MSVPVTSLREEVICTTCLSLPRVAMYQCENGHLICKDCMGKCSSTCPTCKKHLGKIRSIIADKIISLMPLPCQYSEHGCEEELYRDRLVHHEETCQFRPICCVDIACNAKVPFSKMLDHMSKDHESGDFVHANGSEYKSYFIVNQDDFTREIMWISDHLSLDERHFFRECCRSPEGHWHVWIYLLGSEKEAANYRTTIKIVLPSTGEELIYKGKVNALNSSHRDQPSHVCGLTFPDCVAKKFWEQKRIHYEVEIERNPPKKVVKKKSSHHETKDSNRKSINNTTASEASGENSVEAVRSSEEADQKSDENDLAKKEKEKKVKKGETKKKEAKGDNGEDVKETSC